MGDEPPLRYRVGLVAGGVGRLVRAALPAGRLEAVLVSGVTGPLAGHGGRWLDRQARRGAGKRGESREEVCSRQRLEEHCVESEAQADSLSSRPGSALLPDVVGNTSLILSRNSLFKP